MFQKALAIVALVLGIVSLVGCGKPTEGPTITGTVSSSQNITLPKDAVITVRIEDVSKADAPAEIIGEQVIHANGKQLPIPFEVSYDAEQIEENHMYSMRVRIEDSTGKLIFINDTSVPVITRGNPNHDLEVAVIPIGG